MLDVQLSETFNLAFWGDDPYFPFFGGYPARPKENTQGRAFSYMCLPSFCRERFPNWRIIPLRKYS